MPFGLQQTLVQEAHNPFFTTHTIDFDEGNKPIFVNLSDDTNIPREGKFEYDIKSL